MKRRANKEGKHKIGGFCASLANNKLKCIFSFNYAVIRFWTRFRCRLLEIATTLYTSFSRLMILFMRERFAQSSVPPASRI